MIKIAYSILKTAYVSAEKNKTVGLIKSILKFLLFLGVGIGILYFVYQNQEAAYQKECAFKAQYDC